ncbi:hypothetical protein C8F01DRAFT_1255758 [Mycena amicta]|nr:hypothetical protein C8F01DRAFT_1255758 [Mycena amicta]
MSNQAANSLASTTTSEFFAQSRPSSDDSSRSGEEGFALDNRPIHLVFAWNIPGSAGGPSPRPVQLDAVSATLHGSGLKALDGVGFVCNPMACDACKKPVFHPPSLPEFAFTVLCECPHFDSDNYPDLAISMRNKAIGKIAPLNYPVVQGAVVVVKHPRLPNNAALNLDLPLVDIVASDLPVADIIVGRWARDLAHNPDSCIFLLHPRAVGWEGVGSS